MDCSLHKSAGCLAAILEDSVFGSYESQRQETTLQTYACPWWRVSWLVSLLDNFGDKDSGCKAYCPIKVTSYIIIISCAVLADWMAKLNNNNIILSLWENLHQRKFPLYGICVCALIVCACRTIHAVIKELFVLRYELLCFFFQLSRNLNSSQNLLAWSPWQPCLVDTGLKTIGAIGKYSAWLDESLQSLRSLR